MLCDKGQRIRSPCWLGAAALSAAVTTTAAGNRTQRTGGTKPKEKSPQTPAALREGGRGRGASLREAASPQTVDKVVNGLFKWKKARKRQSNVE